MEKNGGVYIKGEESAMKTNRRIPNVQCKAQGPDKVVVIGGYVYISRANQSTSERLRHICARQQGGSARLASLRECFFVGRVPANIFPSQVEAVHSAQSRSSASSALRAPSP